MQQLGFRASRKIFSSRDILSFFKVVQNRKVIVHQHVQDFVKNKVNAVIEHRTVIFQALHHVDDRSHFLLMVRHKKIVAEKDIQLLGTKPSSVERSASTRGSRDRCTFHKNPVWDNAHRNAILNGERGGSGRNRRGTMFRRVSNC